MEIEAAKIGWIVQHTGMVHCLGACEGNKEVASTTFDTCCNNPVASASSLAFPDGGCVDFLVAVEK